MYNLGLYYQAEKDTQSMLKYYLMAIEYKNSYAMYKLGLFYYIEGNTDLMIKYYLMAIEHNNSTAMNNLAIFYYNHDDKELMLKYYHPKKAEGVFLGGVWLLNIIIQTLCII